MNILTAFFEIQPRRLKGRFCSMRIKFFGCWQLDSYRHGHGHVFCGILFDWLIEALSPAVSA
jgi:hypothetical protein